MKWMNGTELVAGCYDDRALKMIDTETGTIKVSVLTDHSVPICLDTAMDKLVLTGCEDGQLRLYDLRAGKK